MQRVRRRQQRLVKRLHFEGRPRAELHRHIVDRRREKSLCLGHFLRASFRFRCASQTCAAQREEDDALQSADATATGSDMIAAELEPCAKGDGFKSKILYELQV